MKLEQKGLSQIDAPPGTLLAYSTAPGNAAADGEGPNGLYTGHVLVMRSAAPKGRIRLVHPAGARTLEAPPEFRWQFDAANPTYRFELADGAGNVLYETDVAASPLKLPTTLTLKENVAYTWSVSTRAADGRRYSTTGEFSLAPASVRQQVATVRPQADASVSDRVAYAAWLEQLELKDEARRVWRSLAAERPQDSRLEALARE